MNANPDPVESEDVIAPTGIAHRLVHYFRSSSLTRTVQDLLGHKDVATTQIYTHIMQKPGIGVKSPLDTG